MPRLSVVIPVYNVERYLRRCLDSAICPDVTDYEVIIVDDGSTDGSQAIIDEYARQYPQLLRVVTTPNNGIGIARNVGIDNAAGEYLLFLDSDDYLAPGAIPQILSELYTPFDIYFFGMSSVTESGKLLSRTGSEATDEQISLENHPELLFESPCACGKILRRALFSDTGIRFPKGVWYEDLRTTPKLYLHTTRIINRPQSWYYYVQRPGSITNSNDAKKNLQIIDAVDDLLGYYRDAGQYERYRDALEFTAFHHELLAAITRVNHIDRKSDVQRLLFDDFKHKYPDYRSNPYVRALPVKHKLLLRFIESGDYLALNIVMRLNNAAKGKTSA